MRIAVGVLMILHGLAHSVGFVSAWRLAPEKVPFNPVLIFGEAGPGTMKVMGALWAVASLAFVLAGYGQLRGVAGWRSFALAAAAFSFVLCVLALPDARMGALINIVLIAALLGQRIAA